MTVFVNRLAVELSEHDNILSLLEKLEIVSTKGIAVAINEQIIRKDCWPSFQFSENDQVLIIKATQGG